MITKVRFVGFTLKYDESEIIKSAEKSIEGYLNEGYSLSEKFKMGGGVINTVVVMLIKEENDEKV